MPVSSVVAAARPRAGPGSAPGRRHDRPRGPSPQAVSTGWRLLLPDRANAAPRRSPPGPPSDAVPGHGPDLGQAPPVAPPLELQDVVHGQSAPGPRLGRGASWSRDTPEPA